MIHELGHIIVIYLSGSYVKCIELYAAGICLHIAQTRSYIWDFVIAVAGPVAGLLAALISAKLGWTYFSGTNVLLSLFNLLIIYPLDGACMAIALLSMTPMGIFGIDIVRLWSVFSSMVLVIAGSWIWMRTGTNPALFCIGCMLFIGNLGYSCKKNGNQI